MSDFRKRAHQIAVNQSKQAVKLLDRTAADFLTMPWPSLDAVVSGMSDGDIWFGGGFSGDGKTTFLTSAVDCWYELGKRIYYLGLESRPKVLKTHWACKRVGIDAGEVLSGKSLNWHNWPEKKQELVAMIHSLDESDSAAQVHFSPSQFVDAEQLREAFKNAVDFGADILIVDHIDHIDGEQGSSFEVSKAVCSTLMREAQRTGIRCLVATQFNNEAIRGNRAGRYLPPQPNYVYMGGHKRAIASGMLGLYRPLKQGLDAETLRQFQLGHLEPRAVLEPDTMAVVCMKHRLMGKYEGTRVYLGVENGRVVDLPSRDYPNVHGIATSRALI